MKLAEYAARVVAARDYVADWLAAARDGQTVFQRRSQMRRTDAARIEATTVDRALADGSQEAAIQLAGQRDAFVRRIDELRAPGRTLTRPESLELFHLAESVKRIDAATFGAGAIDPNARLALFGEVAPARRGFLGTVAAFGGGPWVWAGGALLALLALLGLQSARLSNAKAELAERTADLMATDRALAAARSLNVDLSANIVQAAEGAEQAAETITAERARANAARDRERRLLREIQERTANVGEPPAWDGLGGVRNGAGGDPAGPGADSSGDPGVLPR